MGRVAQAIGIAVPLAIVAFLAWRLPGTLERNHERDVQAAQQAREQAEAAARAPLEKCQRERADTLAEVDKLVAQNRGSQAQALLAPCSGLLGGDEQWAAARQAAGIALLREQLAAVPANDWMERRRLLYAAEDATLPADLKAELARLNARFAKAEAAERAKEAARRRKEGVHIGMTPEDVLASNWGKPTDINRTTTATGVHEQWVYGNGNYLYFDNGRLTAIQN